MKDKFNPVNVEKMEFICLDYLSINKFCYLKCTALVLNEQSADTLALPTRETLHWSGSWGLIAQDTQSITASRKLAVIPFSEGMLALPCLAKPDSVILHNVRGQYVYDGWKWGEQPAVADRIQGAAGHGCGVHCQPRYALAGQNSGGMLLY